MITLPRRKATTEAPPDMTHDELQIEWRKAKVCFDQALIEKTECDRIYVAAATWLNTLERLVKKVEQRSAVDKREAARSLLRAAQVGAQV